MKKFALVILATLLAATEAASIRNSMSYSSSSSFSSSRFSSFGTGQKPQTTFTGSSHSETNDGSGFRSTDARVKKVAGSPDVDVDISTNNNGVTKTKHAVLKRN